MKYRLTDVPNLIHRGVSDPGQRPLRVVFFRTLAKNEPVREWLRTLSREEKKSRTAPKRELDLARKRQAQFLNPKPD